MKICKSYSPYAFIAFIILLSLGACSSEGLDDVDTEQDLVGVVNDVADDNPLVTGDESDQQVLEDDIIPEVDPDLPMVEMPEIPELRWSLVAYRNNGIRIDLEPEPVDSNWLSNRFYTDSFFDGENTVAATLDCQVYKWELLPVTENTALLSLAETYGGVPGCVPRDEPIATNAIQEIFTDFNAITTQTDDGGLWINGAGGDTALLYKLVEGVPVIEYPPEQSPNTEGWPANANGDLPLAGIFYGNYEAGLHTGNAPISIQSSRRFRAQVTGEINAIRYNNRTLNDGNISGRCKPNNPNSVWCKCKRAGLDRYTCGYTLSNSYSVGNGGKIVVEVQTDDGTPEHRPSGVVLASTARPFVPMANASNVFPVLELGSPTTITAGALYHLVFKNINPPTGCSLSGMSIEAAAACPRDKGAMGLNGTSFATFSGPTGRFGPFRGESSANFTYKTGQWKRDEDNLSWYEVRYSDDRWIGDSYAAYGAISSGRRLLTDGAKARQVFTVSDATRRVDGLWLNFGHNYTVEPDGSPLYVHLKDSTGQILANGTIASSAECIAKSVSGYRNGDQKDQHCRAWGYTDLSQTIDLVEGSTYAVELSASRKGAFMISSYFDLRRYGSTSINHWNNAKAEYSTNNGRSWMPWSSQYTYRDLALLFTIEGMPKALD